MFRIYSILLVLVIQLFGSGNAFSFPYLKTYLGRTYSKALVTDAKQLCEKNLDFVVKNLDRYSSSGEVKLSFSRCKETEKSFQIEVEYEYKFISIEFKISLLQ